MPRRRIGLQTPSGRIDGSLVERLGSELRNGRQFGQPTVYEHEYTTGKLRVTVIWDEWNGVPLDERTAIILRAFEQAENADYRDRIALASGLTVPEAQAAGMLPFQIIPALRRNDPVSPEQVREAMLDMGASSLLDPNQLQLRFATEEEADACRRELARRLAGSQDIWLVVREITGHDFGHAQDRALASEG